jgi:hypothetical protein
MRFDFFALFFFFFTINRPSRLQTIASLVAARK